MRTRYVVLSVLCVALLLTATAWAVAAVVTTPACDCTGPDDCVCAPGACTCPPCGTRTAAKRDGCRPGASCCERQAARDCCGGCCCEANGCACCFGDECVC